MASEALRQMSAMVRAANAERPLGSVDVETMRTQFEQQQAALALPEGVKRTDLELGGVRCCRITATGARSDHAVFYLHGGGYVMGSPDTHQELMGRISAALGATVYGVDYRLAPEHPWPAAVEDATRAWQALLAKDTDPARTLIAGDSAGGGLTLALLLELKGTAARLPAGAVVFSPWTDLTASGESIRTRAAADPMIGPDVLPPMAAHYYGTNAPDLPTISPLFGDLAGLPPLLIQVGDAEVLLDDATRLHDRARAAGVDSTLHVYDEAFHVFQAIPGLPEADEALREMAEFSARVW